MSITLYVMENGQRRDIWRLSETRSKLFLGIAEAAANAYKMPSGFYPDGTPSCRVNANELCALIETVFEQPSDLLHPWAQHAAAIYEVIKGELYSWKWSRYHLPIETFSPQRNTDESPTGFSGKKIGVE